jgi:hypothetical protein
MDEIDLLSEQYLFKLNSKSFDELFQLKDYHDEKIS